MLVLGVGADQGHGEAQHLDTDLLAQILLPCLLAILFVRLEEALPPACHRVGQPGIIT